MAKKIKQFGEIQPFESIFGLDHQLQVVEYVVANITNTMDDWRIITIYLLIPTKQMTPQQIVKAAADLGKLGTIPVKSIKVKPQTNSCITIENKMPRAYATTEKTLEEWKGGLVLEERKGRNRKFFK